MLKVAFLNRMRTDTLSFIQLCITSRVLGNHVNL